MKVNACVEEGFKLNKDLLKKIKSINKLSTNEIKSLLENPQPFIEINAKGNNTFPLQSIIGLDIRVANEYPDVPKDHWSYDYILWAHNQGIVFGYPDGYFRPDKLVKQGEFLAVLIRFLKIPLRGRIVREHWTEPYYEVAIKQQWILAEKSNLIYRNSTISFDEISTIIFKAFQLTIPIHQSLDYLTAMSVISGGINANKQLTRAELVAFFYQLSKSPIGKGEKKDA